MKKLTLALLIIAALVSCKKEEPPTPTTPVGPPAMTNYIIVDGDGHNSDTIILDSAQANYYPSAGITQLQGFETSASINMFPACSSTGTFSITQPTPTPANAFYSNGVWYRKINATANVTQYGGVGSTINCNYSGTFKKQSDTTVVITVSGNFNVIRGNDL